MNSKKTLIKAVCVLASATLMTGALTSCGKKTESDSSVTDSVSSDGSNNASAENLVKISYKPEEIKLPDELKDYYYNSISVRDDSILFTYTDYNYDEETQVSTNTTYLCTVDSDGNLVSKTDISAEKINDKDSTYLYNINFLSDGSIMYFESHYYPVSSVENDGETADESSDDEAAAEAVAEEASDAALFDSYNEAEEYENKEYIVRMSSDGSVIDRVSIDDIPTLEFLSENQSSSVSNIIVNSDGDIALTCDMYDEEWNRQSRIIVVDKDFNQLFMKELEGDDTWVTGYFSDSSGNFYYAIYSYDSEEGKSSQILKKINYETGELEDICDWSNISSSALLGGSGDYLAYYYNYNTSSICGVKNDSTTEEIINLLNSGLYLNNVNSIYVSGDDFYVSGDEGGAVSLYKVRKLDESEIKEKEAVTLAAYYSSSDLNLAVAEYNKSDGNYVISVTDYSQYNDYSTDDEDSWNAGITKLNSEISAGQIPDIISIYDTELMSSFSSKGLFVDLNTYIDGEDGLNRDDYFDNIFRAMETDGKLYQITGSVSIQGLCAKKSLIPNDGAVSWEEIDSILSMNSGMKLLEETMTRGTFLDMSLNSGYRNFVNSSTGECSFNSPEFVEILERSNEYPEQFDYDTIADDPDYWDDYYMQYRNNETLLNTFYLYDFGNYYYQSDGMMGEDISIIGMPGSGYGAYLSPTSYISISAKSAHPEAGWELIKSMIEYDEDKYSTSNYYYYSGLPVNKNSLRKLGEAFIESSYYTDEDGNRVQNEINYYMGNASEPVYVRNVDQDLIDKVEAFISSTDNVYMGVEEGIMDIITEEAEAYYAGTSTSQQAADNIQSRASLYLSEHM